MSINYITQSRAAFAQLSAEPAATAQHISLYVALFQRWNNAHFPAWIMLMRDEVMASAHLGSRATYLNCLRDLTAWGLIIYEPSQSQHQPSRAWMLELPALGSEVSPAANEPPAELESKPSTAPSCAPSRGPAVGQAAGPISKTTDNAEDHGNPPNLLDPVAPAAKKIGGNASRTGSLPAAQKEAQGRGQPKEKVALKRKPPATERAAPRPDHPFANSALADPAAFAAAFAGTDFELANLPFYYEKVANWRKDGEPPLRRDWKATAKNFMLNDIERNALVLAPGTKRGPNGRLSRTDVGTSPADYVSARYN